MSNWNEENEFFDNLPAEAQGKYLMDLGKPVVRDKCYAVFLGEGGWDHEVSEAVSKGFKIGEKYEITGGTEGQSWTELRFAEIPGKFNSVMFEYDRAKAPIESLFRGFK